MSSRRTTVLIAVAASFLMVVGSATAAIKSFVTAPLDDDMYVVLVLGSDQGPFRSGKAVAGRSDAIHLVTIVPDARRVTILSFPRDSWVAVPGFGRTKINAALTRGPDVAVETMENLTGIDIDDWVVTSFRGLKRGIDKLGGIEIDVEQRLFDPRGARSDLRPGEQTLTGKQALAYVRDRKSRARGDFGRSAAQAKLLKALHRQLREGGGLDLMRATRYMELFERHTETSISTPQQFRLARLLVRIRPKDVDRHLVDGAVGTAGAASVVYITDAGRSLIADVRRDGVVGKLGD